MTSPEITDAMVEAACRAYHGLHGNNCYADCMKVALSAALAAGVAPGVKVLPDNFIERHAEGYEWRGDSGDYTPKEHEVAMLIDFGHSLLSELPADPRLQTMRAVLKEARGVFKCLMASGEHKDAIASGVMASIDAALSALEHAPSALVAEPGEPVAWPEVADKLFWSAKEFIDDWKKGDFSLSTLAALDAQSLDDHLVSYSEARRAAIAVSPVQQAAPSGEGE